MYSLYILFFPSLSVAEESRRSVLAKSWAAPDSYDRPSSGSKSREYNRPWLHGSKKVKGDHTSNKENYKHGIIKIFDFLFFSFFLMIEMLVHLQPNWLY